MQKQQGWGTRDCRRTGPDQECLWAGPTLGQEEPTKELQEEDV